MSNHAPGPWAIDRDDRPGMEWNNHIVACVKPDMAICFMTNSYGDDNSEAEANARLIAAAPDLLEALQGVLRVADRATDEFDAARAAISKATWVSKSDAKSDGRLTRPRVR